MTDYVTSPAGERVEVFSDEDWLAKTGEDRDQALRQSTARRPILTALWEHGAYEDPKGFAMSALYRDATARGYSGAQTSLTSVLRKPVMAPAVVTAIRGHRTYRVALAALPQRWRGWLVDGSGRIVEPEPVEPATLTVVEPEPDFEDWKPDREELTVEVAQSVATALLAQVIDIVSTGKPDTARLDALKLEVDGLRAELESASCRLADALTYGQRIRRQLEQNGDELTAVKAERDGLRQRVRMAEANLAKAMSPANQRTLDEIVHREVDKVMRATPVHRSPDDA